jgi:type IV pilus assembly protein PilQ
MGGAVGLLTTQPVWAAAAQVTAVRLNPQESGLELILETETGNKRPEVFMVSRGNDWVADIVNTQLSLREGDSFRQENPMPGITSVLVSQLDANNVRVTVSGASSPPTGQILQNEGQGITLGISTESKNQAAAPSPASPSPTAPVSAATPALPVLQAATPLPQRSNSPTILAQTPTPEPVAQQQAPASPTPVVPTVIPQPIVPAPTPDVLVPNPRITIDGVPAPATGAVQPVAPAPPFLPRAIAPPVGDIAISNINAAASSIDLGTGVRVPRLVLREAPVREVLALLARSAGLNLAFTGEGGARPGGGQGAAPAAAQQTISLDLEDEPVQDVFNYVLRISGLQANRVGRTIFVGSQLPDAARNIVARTLRLNQVPVGDAVGFLIGQGAEQQQITTQTSLTVVGEGAAAQRIENTTTSVQRITPQTQGQGQGGQGLSGPLTLRGLAVAADDRLNAITLIGEPRQVEIASAFLTQLDLRRRQVAVNVKIVDVNLLGTDAFNSSFSFGIGDSFFVNDGGAASFNYGGFNPPTQLQVGASTTSPPVISNPFAGANVFQDPNNFTAIQGTAPGTTIVDARTGSVTRTPLGAASFNTPFVTLTDPLQPGFTNITPATNDIITISPNGNITVTAGTVGTATVGLPSLFRYPTRFLSALQAQITSGNAKILTDPTLVVQEGETATVNLTQEVVGNIESETESAEGIVTRTVTAEIREAGLILEIAVTRIDDNGFISLAVNPRVTAIGNIQDLSVGDDTNQIALLNVRQLRSGQIRLRDSQTLILSGIIQESDRTTVSKVPILGDIPLLGALFRSTNRQNQRQEVIVLLTPQIIDDSAASSFGYNYTPGRESRQILQREGISP